MSLESIKATRAEMQKMREQLNSQVKDAFHAEAKAIMERHPKLERFSWTQYTPYFNDGDACHFSASTDEIELTFDGDEMEYYSIGDYGQEREKNIELKAAAKDLHELLSAFDDDDYEHMFGDHVRVTVTREGVSVDEYSHD